MTSKRLKNILIILIAFQVVIISGVAGYITKAEKRQDDTVLCININDFGDSSPDTTFIELEEEESVVNNKHWSLIHKSKYTLLSETTFTFKASNISCHISEIASPPPRYI